MTPNFSPKEIWDEVSTQIGVAWPITFAMLLRRSVDIISVIYVVRNLSL